LGRFIDIEEYRDYNSSYMQIKHVIAFLNDNHQSGILSDVDYRNKLLNVWIPLTTAFEDDWGASFVISDVGAAIDDVRANLGLAARNWPAMIEVTEEEAGV
jgi:hypothetical protein